MLDAGLLPVEDLAVLASREGRRPRPIYGAHRWFARRFGSAFRALLVAAALPEGEDFWTAYYEGTDYWSGKTVLDPFVGGGTSVVEASRLGANVIGVDVDAVACAITRFETRAAGAPDVWPALRHLKQRVGKELATYYRTVTAEGEEREVLHYFWVQQVPCRVCGESVEAHPHYQLAYEAEGDRQWAFCPNCHGVQDLGREETELRCDGCEIETAIEAGPVRYGRLTCPSCGSSERLIDVAARTGRRPEWRLFALETLEAAPTGRSVPLAQRRFRAATPRDLDVLESAERALLERAGPDGILWVPSRCIPREGRVDDRLLRYGYDRYAQLFNARQLLHLSLLAEAIDGLHESVRESMALAFSDHLATNCMMSHYAFGWRRLAPLFSVRAYRHISRPVEINPWLDGTGRGTFPNTVRQVQRAIEFARHPKEPLIEGGFRQVFNKPTAEASGGKIVHANSRRLSRLADASVDLVLTDPPYLDNVAYSELSDFFLPWLQLLGLAAGDGEGVEGFEENLAAKGRDAAAVEEYASSLADSFSEIARVLKADGRLVFTYQHQVGGAWYALARAIAAAGLRPIQVFPLLGDGNAGSHNHEGTSKWDAVFVLVKDDRRETAAPLEVSEGQAARVGEHYGRWTERLSSMTEGEFRSADRRNFFRACLIAGALGMFPSSEDDHRTPLRTALEQPPVDRDLEEEKPDAATV